MSSNIVANVVYGGLIYLFQLIELFLPVAIVKKLSDFAHIYSRDIRHLITSIKGLRAIRKFQEEKSVISKFKKTVQQYADKVCLVHENNQMTFREVEELSDKICNVVGAGLHKGDVVALMLPNCLEYSCVWLGLSQIGVITALINTNLRMKPLSHSISVAKPKAIIYSNQYDSAISEILNDIDGDPELFCFEGGSTIERSINLQEKLKSANPRDIPKVDVTMEDIIIYIYTSGTTGLPKPAKVSNLKLYAITLLGRLGVGITPDDIVYCPKPLYHGGGTGGVVNSFLVGATTIIKTKFSASSYISDCQKYGATIGQYIGEMIRYVANSEEKAGETNHRLRIVAGNGVRGEVWKKFVKRFKVPQISEYYGSTEGNFFLINNCNKVGSCGYLPISLPKYYMLGPSLIKIDEETGEPKRNKKGFCILADPGEIALLIGLCPPGNIARKFDGYINENDTNSKKIHNVFKIGDTAFNTGDLMIMDELGWLTFVDRIGDTYRWKGENVSTAEVEAILCSFPPVTDCAVYGVQVENVEGKAGMAAIAMKNLDLEALERYISSNLPPYAQPLFLRLVDSLQTTTTYKVIKTKLMKQGYDVSVVTDPLLIKVNGKYIPITNEIYMRVKSGNFNV